MAKKQSMNLIEAHMEKIAISAAGLVFLWILVTRFILASGIESGGTVKPVEKAVEDAAQLADGKVDSTKKKPGTPPPTPVPPPNDPTEAEPFLIAASDRIPLGPSNDTKMINQTIRAKIENFPKQLVSPQTLAVGIYHTRAAATSARIVNTGGIGEVQDQEVDFVTVEATFPMKQLRSQFQQAFLNPKLEEDPVEHPDPILAAVELQRSQLLPTGSWSEWQKIPRLDIEPGAVSELASEDFAEYSLQKYKTILELRGEFATQKRVLQPEPYALVTEVWLNPSEKAKVKKEKSDTRMPAGAGLANRLNRGRPSPGAADRGGRRSPAPRRGGGESSYYGGEEESYYGGEESGYGPSGRDRGRGNYGRGYGPGIRPARRATSRENTEAKKYLEEDEVTLWAHDGTVVPGVVYRYRIRLGCFNPVAGKERFLPQDSKYKNKIILWSDYLPNRPTDYKYVRVNKRVLFFPKTASAGNKAVASVEVFRQHEGKWYLRPYSVIPGSMIGGIDPPLVRKSRTVAPRPTPGRTTPGRRTVPGRSVPGIPARTSANPILQNEPEEIDFRTGITVIDITSKTDHWYSSGSANSLNKLVTADLIYRDVDGFVKRIPVDSRCWPKELRDELSGIRKKMREPRTPPNSPRSLNRRGTSGRGAVGGS